MDHHQVLEDLRGAAASVRRAIPDIWATAAFLELEAETHPVADGRT